MATGNRYEPYQVVDPDGVVMDGAAQFFRDLLAAGKAESTVCSYGTDLLRWFRFCWAVRVDWDRATRIEARDFSRWLRVAGKQSRPHWRAGPQAAVPAGARDGEAYAHHNPMEPYGNERSGLYRPKVPSRVPRSIPDGEFNEIFARLPSHRDRALVAFYVSTGARASELLSATVAGTDPGRQVITVVRKGTRELQELPASTDAFVWLRLYQVEMDGLIPKGRRQPLWWTLRRPVRPRPHRRVRACPPSGVPRRGPGLITLPPLVAKRGARIRHHAPSRGPTARPDRPCRPGHAGTRHCSAPHRREDAIRPQAQHFSG